MRILNWKVGTSILTYLMVAFSLFAYVRLQSWQNWEAAAAEWYLLEPPSSTELPGDTSLDSGAPISQWSINQTYQSKIDCEKGQTEKGTFARERCMPASNLGIQHADEWWSLVPSDLLSRRNPSQITLNFLRNLPQDFVNLGRNLLLRPADLLSTTVGFLFVAWLVWRAAIFTVGAFRGSDYQELRLWAVAAMLIFGIGFFLLLSTSPYKWPWEWAAGFAFSYLVHQHAVRADNSARLAGLRGRLLSSLRDAAEGLCFLGLVLVCLFLLAFYVDLIRGKLREAWPDLIWVLAAMALGWIGFRFFKFGYPFRDRDQHEIGSQAWLRENPGRLLVARSLGLGKPPWNEQQISRLRGRLDEIHAEWEAKVDDYMKRHPATDQ